MKRTRGLVAILAVALISVLATSQTDAEGATLSDQECLKKFRWQAKLRKACQDKGASPPPAAVSLDEAKQVTTDFGGDFTPPPRSIGDIVSLVEKYHRRSSRCRTDRSLSDDEFKTMMRSLPLPRRSGLGRV